MATAPNITPAGPNDFMRPQEWHEAINPFAAAYRGVTPLLTGNTQALRPEDYDFFRAMQEAQAQQNAARQGQMTNADAILARALGQGGPSLAEMQLRQSTDQMLKQQAGLLGSQRGQNPALAAWKIADQGGMAQQQLNAQLAMQRAQEQQAAQALAAQAYGAIRGQDQGMFGASSEGRQGQNTLNVNADLTAQGQNLQRDLANQSAIQNQQAMQYGSDKSAAQRNINIVGGIGQAAVEKSADIGKALATATTGIPTGYTGGVATQRGFMPMADGGVVPGTPIVPGDSPVNDMVPALLAPKEVVIPSSKATPDGAYEFVKGLQSQTTQDDRMARIFDLQARLDALKQSAGPKGMAYGGVVAGKKAC